MPATPVTWSDADFTANTNINGTQSGPRITQLANGNVLICWTDFDNTVGSEGGNTDGADVIGRIFDPLGNSVSGEIRLNTTFTLDDEQDPEITALSNGGFMVVYEDNGTDNNLGYETYSASGFLVEGDVLLNDAIGGDVPNSPAVASATLTSVMTAYIVNNADGSESVLVRPYNPDTDVAGTAATILTGNPGPNEDIGGIGLTALSDDNFALVIANRNPGDDNVTIRILDDIGAVVGSATLSPEVEIGRIQCVGLTGGNFAIVFENLTSGTIVGAVCSNTGALVDGPSQISNVTGGQISPAVAALADGGYVVVWDDNTNSDIRGQRYSNAGFQVGDEFVIDGSGSQSAPSVVGLADGRFQVSWTEADNIRSEIHDPRDLPNSPAVYTPASQIIGTIGNDVISADAARAYGHNGNDTMTDGNSSTNSMYGGAGNDEITIFGTDSDEFADGGDDIDTLIGGAIDNGTHYNLLTGQLINGLIIQSILNFENATGTGSDEQFTGTTASNTLEGGAGNDTIDGGTGIDQLVGGVGNDTYIVRDAASIIDDATGQGTADRALFAVSYVLAGADNIERMQTTSFAGTGAINLTGNALSQTLIGNAGINTLDGGTGVDTLTGSLGNDTYIVRNAATNIDEGAGLGTADRALFAVSYVLAGSDNIEFLQTTSFAGTGAINLTGNAISQTIVGNAGANRLDGKGGNDTLNGGAGADVFVFTATLGAGNVDRIQSYASASDQIELESSVFTGMIDTNALLAGSAFTSNTTGQATAGTHRIIHETDTGFLWFDQDGVAGGAIHFATVDIGVVLTAGEFTVI